MSHRLICAVMCLYYWLLTREIVNTLPFIFCVIAAYCIAFGSFNYRRVWKPSSCGKLSTACFNIWARVKKWVTIYNAGWEGGTCCGRMRFESQLRPPWAVQIFMILALILINIYLYIMYQNKMTIFKWSIVLKCT